MKLFKMTKKLQKQLNSFFENAVSSLKLNENSFVINNEHKNIQDPTEKIIVKYQFHPSILINKNKIENTNTFRFKLVMLSDIKNEINGLNPNKATTHNNIPPKILWQSADVTGNTLQLLFNNAISNSEFPENLKLADVTPVFKKKDPLDKTNYRPVSVLPPVSKIFERLMQKQINEHIKNKLSPYLCGYRKGFSTQYALLSIIERWKKILDEKGFGGAVLMDLSKAFDTLNHELLIAKLSAYGFNNESLKLIRSYLTNRWQRTKINKSFSRWTELLQGVPQGSVLGPLLFNIYLNDLFFLVDYTEVCNFADDTTFFACDKDLGSLINRLQHDRFLAIESFQNNYMKLNENECHLLVGGYKNEIISTKIVDARIWESNKQEL